MGAGRVLIVFHRRRASSTNSGEKSAATNRNAPNSSPVTDPCTASTLKLAP